MKKVREVLEFGIDLIAAMTPCLIFTSEITYVAWAARWI
jgi:hypothetical protein